MATDKLRELLRDFPPELRDANWRLSDDGERPVLRWLPSLTLEVGDARSDGVEPDPLEAGLRVELARLRDTAGEPHESEWWEDPYKGGGPADVAGFPRPLYPPDVPPSTGYKPSPKGPDAKAYKRTVS